MHGRLVPFIVRAFVAPGGLVGLVAIVACSSDSSSPRVLDDATIGDAQSDTAFPVEHEPACDPGPTALAEHSVGPSTRVVTLVSKKTPLSPAGKDSPSAHDAMVKYLADGQGDFAKGPAQDGGVVDDLLPGAGPSAAIAGRKSVAFLNHISDFQLADDESPTRLAAFDNTLSSGALRPQEGAVARVASAMHRTLAALTKSRPLDFEVITGDCADSSQQNEHAWFIALMNGQKGLNVDSGDDDDPVLGPDNDVKDPFDAVVTPTPWYFVFGNHDEEIQGTSRPDEGTILSAIGNEPKNGTRDYRLMYAPVTRELVPEDPRRKQVGVLDIMQALEADGAAPGPPGHGFAKGATSPHYVIDPIPGVPLRLIEINTNDPDAGSDGQVTQKTIDEFLEPALIQAEKDGKLVIMASHHSTTNIDPGKGLGSTPVPGALTGVEVEAVVAKHPNVILWLVGHNHRNRVRAIKGPSAAAPGYYEVMTDAIADWPSQTRLLELLSVPSPTGSEPTLAIYLTMVDYDARSCLEARFRTWSLVDVNSGWSHDGTGEVGARNVELRRAIPKGVSLAGLGKDKIETETTLLGR